MEHLLSLERRLGPVVAVGGLEGVEALGELERRSMDGARKSSVDAAHRLLAEAPGVLDEVIRRHSRACRPIPLPDRVRTGPRSFRGARRRNAAAFGSHLWTGRRKGA